MSFPRQHRSKLHSTHPFERLNGEIKRRANVVGIFPNQAAITRPIGAVAEEPAAGETEAAAEGEPAEEELLTEEPVEEFLDESIDTEAGTDDSGTTTSDGTYSGGTSDLTSGDITVSDLGGTTDSLTDTSDTTTDSGLDDTATGNSVFLFVESGVVFAREGTDASSAATGGVVFTVGVDAAGTVTLDQLRAVVHSNPSDPSDSVTLSASNLVRLTATITDNDGDSQSATLDIGQSLTFEDDAPVAVQDSDLNVTEGDADMAGTNLLANDDIGADSAGAFVSRIDYTDAGNDNDNNLYAAPAMIPSVAAVAMIGCMAARVTTP